MNQDDTATLALLEFLNACEAGIIASKKLIAENKQLTEEPEWNPANISWALAEGNRGPYERSQGSTNLDFNALLKDLNEHDGKLSKDGYFYWIFQDSKTVGRKKAKTTQR